MRRRADIQSRSRVTGWLAENSWGRRVITLLVLGVALLALAVFAGSSFAAAATLGGLVGATELLSRYRDAPLRAVLSVPAVVYVGVNAAASVGALAVSNGFGWNFGLDGSPPDADTVEWTRVVVAGFGAAALFRSSLFVRRMGSEDVDIGPSSALKILLEVTDEAVDRGSGTAIVNDAAQIMREVPGDDLIAISDVCLNAMQTMDAGRSASLAERLNVFDVAHAGDLAARRLAYGELLVKYYGRDVVRGAVESIRELRAYDDAHPVPTEQPIEAIEVGVTPSPPSPPPVSEPS